MDYLTASDIEDVVRTEDLTEYAKSEDIPDVSNFATKDDLVDFLTSSDVEDYVKSDDIKDFITSEALENLASKSDLEGYVKTEDAVDYLTASDLDDYLKVSELPTNVSAFINDAGYLTEHQDLSNYATKSELPTLGTFPVVGESEDSDEGEMVNGYASVNDVVEYVNSYISELKKKGEIDGSDYIYINAVEYNDGVYTLSPIYQMNCYEITDDAFNNEGMVLHLIANNEKVGMEGEGDETIENYSQVLTVDIPEGYTFEIYGWNPIGSAYSNATTIMISNPRGATKQYGNKVYNSYTRQTNDLYYDVLASSTRYKIIIRKNN